MTCEQARAAAADLLEQPETAVPLELASHWEACGQCRREAAQVREMWALLAQLPEAEPSGQPPQRFYAALADETKPIPFRRPARRWLPAGVGPAIAAMLLIGLGWLGGRWSFAPPTRGPEAAQLHEEVEQLRQTVALSMLQQSSASDRLRGVSFSTRVTGDPAVSRALIRTLTEDSNVNVRLAAVDALVRFGGDAAVRQALLRALGREESPLVQVGLIDALVQLRDQDARPAFTKLSGDDRTDPAVRHRAQWGVRQFE